MIFRILSIGEKLGQIIKDAFGVNLTEFLINFGATVVLIIIVRFFFWNKVTAFLDSKKEKIKNEYQESEDLKKEANELNEEAKKNLDNSKSKAQEIISIANVEAREEKERIIKSAKEESERIINDSREEALREKDEILKNAKGEVIDIASLMASKMIDKEIDQKEYNNKVLEELDK